LKKASAHHKNSTAVTDRRRHIPRGRASKTRDAAAEAVAVKRYWLYWRALTTLNRHNRRAHPAYAAADD